MRRKKKMAQLVPSFFFDFKKIANIGKFPFIIGTRFFEFFYHEI